VSDPDHPKKKPPQPTIQWDPNEGPPEPAESSPPQETTTPAPKQFSGQLPGPAPGEQRPKTPQPTLQWDPSEAPPEDEADASVAPAPDSGGESEEDSLVGTLLRDKWRVLKRLGAGSFGTVYKVQDVKGGWIEALKILGVDRITGSEAENVRKRFLREAQIMKRLGTQSPHIVGLSTYEEDLEAGLIYFLMELVEGKSLADALAEDGPFSVERTLQLALQVCDALVVAHEDEAGVVHRDLKLENIMLTRDRSGNEIAKVLDFGIAKIAERDADSRLTTVGTLGTPGFAAPEQLRAEEVDGRTDLFAFGVILYCLLTGRDPWFGNAAWESTTQIYELMVATERAEVRPMAGTGVEVPPALANVVIRLLRRNPEDRFPSARELKGALQRIIQGGDALEAGSLRVLTEEPGVEVEVRFGRKVVAKGPTPRIANGVMQGSYMIVVRDPRYEAAETKVTLGPGAMEDVTLLITPRKEGFGATLKRRMGTLAAAAVVVLLAAGVAVVQPWGRTLSLAQLTARTASGSVTGARLTSAGIEGKLALGPLPAPFKVPVSQEEAPAVVEDLRSAGLVLDTSWEVARLIRLAAQAQSQMRYFGRAGEDVRSFAERAQALEVGSPEAHSLLLKVAERMAWDAEAALADGEPERAQELLRECLSVAPGHPRCLAAAGEG
jgi:serine/threonine protein kinase